MSASGFVAAPAGEGEGVKIGTVPFFTEYLKLLYYLIRPDTVLLRRFSKGIGDNLMLSCLLPHLRNKYPSKKIVVETEYPELFQNNPYADFVTARHIKTTARHLKPVYHISEKSTEHIITQMLGHIGITDFTEPKMYLIEEEMAWARKEYSSGYIAICPDFKKSFSANRKEWAAENFRNLCALLREFRFVQIGPAGSHLLEGVIDARGLPLRRSAAVMANSIFFIGTEGGLMHMARALGKKAVIIYGGAILAGTSGYSENLNITNITECSPCFHSDYPHEDCTHKKCMYGITPEAVAEKIRAGFRNLLI
ncbi:MAG: glycosyltransferase family 9 protein [bacterium]